MILKVEDALKSLSRTDPESEAFRDPLVLFPADCCANGVYYSS